MGGSHRPDWVVGKEYTPFLAFPPNQCLTVPISVSREIAELHKSNATQDSRAQQAALSAEMQVREELKMAMEQQKQHHQQEREALIMQVGGYFSSSSSFPRNRHNHHFD